MEYEKIQILTNKVKNSKVFELNGLNCKQLSLSENVKYVIADLPPAIYLQKKI